MYRENPRDRQIPDYDETNSIYNVWKTPTR